VDAGNQENLAGIVGQGDRTVVVFQGHGVSNVVFSNMFGGANGALHSEFSNEPFSRVICHG
jgi:hypothetical protein